MNRKAHQNKEIPETAPADKIAAAPAHRAAATDRARQITTQYSYYQSIFGNHNFQYSPGPFISSLGSVYDYHPGASSNLGSKVKAEKKENNPLMNIDGTEKIASMNEITKLKNRCLQTLDSQETDLYPRRSLSSNYSQEMFHNQRKIYNRDSLLKIGKSQRSLKPPISLYNCDSKEIISKEGNETARILEYKQKRTPYRALSNPNPYYYLSNPKTYTYNAGVSSNSVVSKMEREPLCVIDPAKPEIIDLTNYGEVKNKFSYIEIQPLKCILGENLYQKRFLSSNDSQEIFKNQRKTYNRDSLLKIGKSQRSHKSPFSSESWEFISIEGNEIARILGNKTSWTKYRTNNTYQYNSPKRTMPLERNSKTPAVNQHICASPHIGIHGTGHKSRSEEILEILLLKITNIEETMKTLSGEITAIKEKIGLTNIFTENKIELPIQTEILIPRSEIAYMDSHLDVLNHYDSINKPNNVRDKEDESHFPESHESLSDRYTAPKVTAFMEGVSGVNVVTDLTIIEVVQQKVRDLMNSTRYDFIGSQPVSMTMENVQLLATKKYMVSWKADGTRYLMLIADKDLIYMIDRDNCVYKVETMNIPKNDVEHHSDTLVDGEMVIDESQNMKYPRFLIYDIVAIDQEYVGNLAFLNRLHIIKSKIVDTRNKYVTADLKCKESFGIRIKDFWPIGKTHKIWEGQFRQQLCHKMDGLIFQPSGANDHYNIGRCITSLKWKPPQMNSIDFLLRCEYVKEKNCPPRFDGCLCVGGARNPFGKIENIKKNLRDQYNNRIVECTFNTQTLQWNILRGCTDKSIPNHITTATSVLESIKHPVTIEHVYETINNTKNS